MFNNIKRCKIQHKITKNVSQNIHTKCNCISQLFDLYALDLMEINPKKDITKLNLKFKVKFFFLCHISFITMTDQRNYKLLVNHSLEK